VKGASEGEGKGNDFLQHIRETDAIAEVVRIFDDQNILHVDGEVNPLRDIETINLELVLADLQSVTKRLLGLEKDLKRASSAKASAGQGKEALLEESGLRKVEAVLSEGKFASIAGVDEKEFPFVKNMQLLTMKPILYVLNKKAGGNNLDDLGDERWKKLVNFFDESKSKYVLVDANIENELKEFEGEEKESFRKELGAKDDGVNNLILSSYDLLGLMTYFTTGEDETRGWTIKLGSTAPVAGMAIHTDFRDKFIRAEIIEYSKLLEAGSYSSAREKGWVRTEGKEYIVQDGDVVEFKI
jgi:GTP-binding protein YchF